MPTAIEIVFAPDDEKQFFSFLEPYALTLYPDRIPPDYVPLPVKPSSSELLTEEGYYLAAETLAPIVMRFVKKGKDRGYQTIDEVGSPVIHYERCLVDEKGELRAGKLWTELNFTGDVQRNNTFPEAFRRMWLSMRDHLLKRCHRSDPSGYLIGPQAARLAKGGLLMREAGRKGGPLRSYK